MCDFNFTLDMSCSLTSSYKYINNPSIAGILVVGVIAVNDFFLAIVEVSGHVNYKLKR